MLTKILPTELIEIISSQFNINKVNEVRLRRGLPICVLCAGQFVQLKNKQTNKTIFCDKKLLDYVIMRATEASLYCYNNQLKNCYLAVAGGIRIGVAGEVVFADDSNVKTIKNISSLNIRIPHQVLNCAMPVLKYVEQSNCVNNCLIISPPSAGKTTFIRDLARILSSGNKITNVLIADERYEICANNQGVNQLDVGLYTDCISGTTKKFAFIQAVRAIRPDVIVCDELINKEDCEAVEFAINSGVSVIATVHGNSFNNLKQKQFINTLLQKRYFDYYIFLSNEKGAGTISGVFNKDFKAVW